MKAAILVWLLAVLTSAGFGQDFDPFADIPLPPDPDNPDRDKPKMIRVQVEFVEVAHVDYTRLMAGRRDHADATPLRKKLAKMAEQDRAEVVETMMVVARSGEMATSESVQESIYPTEYEPPGWDPPPLPAEWLRMIENLARLRMPATSSAFETRNLGSTFAIAPNLGVKGKVINLNLAPERVIPAGYEVYSEFKAIGGHVHQDKWPMFVTQRVNTAVTCRDGQYVLLTVLTPSDDNGQLDPGRKLLVLVKCDVLLVK